MDIVENRDCRLIVVRALWKKAHRGQIGHDDLLMTVVPLMTHPHAKLHVKTLNGLCGLNKGPPSST